MLSKRIIVCLDVRDGRLTKGVRFSGNEDIGDPVESARRYYEEGADEIVFYDITASVGGTASTSMPTTTACEPKASAPRATSSGSRTAAELTETFSAPARSTARMSATLAMPPPTEKGMNISRATRVTTSRKKPRRSAEAVMS